MLLGGLEIMPSFPQSVPPTMGKSKILPVALTDESTLVKSRAQWHKHGNILSLDNYKNRYYEIPTSAIWIYTYVCIYVRMNVCMYT